MKLLRNSMLSLLGFLLISNSYATPGLFFNVTSKGGTLFEVQTNVPTHPLPYNTAGLVVNTVGFSAVSGAGVDCNPGGNICIFPQIGNNLPISVNITGPVGQPLDLILCLNMRAVQSCQHYTVSIPASPPKPKRAYITNSADNERQETPTISKCDVDESGNLINCSTALSLPGPLSPVYVVANTANNFVYIVNGENPISPSPSELSRCAMADNGDLIDCIEALDPAIQISALTFNAAQTIAYVSTNTGEVHTCPIDVTGKLNCVIPFFDLSPNPLSDIERNPNPALSYAYVIEPGLASSEVYKCTIDGAGIISSCEPGVAVGVISFRNIVVNPAGTFAYLSDSTESVWQCPIDQTNGDIDFLGCNPTPAFFGPWGLSLNAAGTVLYVVNNEPDTVSKCSINPADGSIILPCITTANDLSDPIGIALLNI